MSLSSRSFTKFSPSVDRRRLAALMFTDIVGYSAIFHRDEVLAMQLLEKKAQLLRQLFPTYGGREIKSLGDGFLIEFTSIQEAVKCAYDIQSHLFQMNLGAAVDEKFSIRIGIHLCDFIATEDDAFGDDVNISSRLEKLAEPGGICVSQQVVDQVRDKLDLKFRLLKQKQLKNIKRPVMCYSVDLPWLESRSVDEIVMGMSQKYRGFLNPKGVVSLLWQISMVAIFACICYRFLTPGQHIEWGDFSKGIMIGLTAVMVLNPVLAFISMIWWLSMPDRRLLYFSLTFVLSSLSLPAVVPHFFGLDSQTVAILPIFASGLIPFCFVMNSSVESKRVFAEVLAGICFAAFALTALVGLSADNLESLKRVLLILSVFAAIYQFSEAVRMRKSARALAVGEVRRGIFSLICTVSYVASAWSPFDAVESLSELGVERFFSIIYPLSVLVIIMYRQFADGKELAVEQKNWATLSQINGLICSGDSFDDKISNIQEKLCKNLRAERSTIYLTDVDSSEIRLKAQSIYGPTEKLKEIALFVSPDQGLIGRVWRTRNPMIVNDISTDDRISDDERPTVLDRKNYRTDSCLLCPLILGNETFGVMTFSDKVDGSVFTEHELRLVQLVAKDVSLMSLNSRFQFMVDHFIAEKLGNLTKAG